ncbi:methyltransferase domain-containing protein [Variovorax sp. YR216]|uniref:methyltransferase domain-containing protein n=1 Tax=Variovorax sp. YR216 TaxID=1882828 RepID=UPI000897E239|nr:methyltransferase domain-containing protein [Variovorax sp. YR216]SEA45611.1 Predicted methyltransferase, contains TPR repeat [Variovorax sp. YR216]
MSTTPAPEAFEQARQRFFEGLEAFKAGRFADAEQAYLASLALVPGRVSTLINLAAAQLGLGRPQDALVVIEQILAIEPENAEAWFHKANALGQLNRHPEALASHEKVLQLGTLPPGETWLRHGQTLQALGRPAQALDSYDRALAADPGIAQAWTNRGSILRDMKRGEEAAAAFRQALALGADPELHRYYLASVSGEHATPTTAPGHYVETLFDDYAHDFDAHLVGQLGYQAHRTLATHLAELGRGFRSALDLGCGTGLCAPYLKPLADKLVGVDLSRQMLQKADALGLYERLVHADITAYLAQTDERHDLVTAADVFIYVGDLAPVFAALHRVLEPGGIFCFSAETAADENAAFELLPSLRYAHSERYLRGLAADHGLDVVRLVHAPIRDDQRESIAGMFVYLRRPENAR